MGKFLDLSLDERNEDSLSRLASSVGNNTYFVHHENAIATVEKIIKSDHYLYTYCMSFSNFLIPIDYFCACFDRFFRSSWGIRSVQNFFFLSIEVYCSGHIPFSSALSRRLTDSCRYERTKNRFFSLVSHNLVLPVPNTYAYRHVLLLL